MNHSLIHQSELLFSIHDDKNHQDGDNQIDVEPNIGYHEKSDPYISSFVCLLIPRFEEHLIVGDLSEYLNILMKDICISYGWRLKFLDIKPSYLHWIMTVNINSFPDQFMKIVRRETSQKIFGDFPRFKQKNMSDEFWAPWYYVGIGVAPYSQNTIQNFINQIRIEQGLH